MPALPILFKTVSTDCNLDCSYCYYRESLEGSRVRRRMDNGLLERFIPAYMDYVADVRVATMAWQGGEPTLAGLPFFQKVMDLQRAHARAGTAIQNSLQTNGVLLDDAWGVFLRENRWLVGVSLDGPRQVHDAPRRDRGGAGSFDRVMRGIDVLRRHEVDFNILCVLGQHNVERAGELMRFYRSEGFTHVQFIPAMDFQAIEPEKPPTYLMTPEQYGAFLVRAFDDWYGSGTPTLSVRLFDNVLQNLVGVPPNSCVQSGRCDAGIVVEWDGSAYPCDFYVHPGWRLGNVLEQPLREVVEGPARQAFVYQKQPLPQECARCPWLNVCQSGCPRNRPRTAGAPSPDYFCASYKALFTHTEERLRALRDRVHHRFRYMDLLEMAPRQVRRAGPNDPCPCGSGSKHKKCCLNSDLARSYLLAAPTQAHTVG